MSLCPVCKSDDRKVIGSRPARDGYQIRMNVCQDCGSTYATRVWEEVVPVFEYRKAKAADQERRKKRPGVAEIYSGTP